MVIGLGRAFSVTMNGCRNSSSSDSVSDSARKSIFSLSSRPWPHQQLFISCLSANLMFLNLWLNLRNKIKYLSILVLLKDLNGVFQIQDKLLLTYMYYIQYIQYTTGCSLNIVFFSKDFRIFQTLIFSVFPWCQCVYTHQEGRTTALQQNWQSSEKLQNFLGKTTHPHKRSKAFVFKWTVHHGTYRVFINYCVSELCLLCVHTLTPPRENRKRQESGIF